MTVSLWPEGRCWMTSRVNPPTCRWKCVENHKAMQDWGIQLANGTRCCFHLQHVSSLWFHIRHIPCQITKITSDQLVKFIEMAMFGWCLNHWNVASTREIHIIHIPIFGWCKKIILSGVKSQTSSALRLLTLQIPTALCWRRVSWRHIPATTSTLQNSHWKWRLVMVSRGDYPLLWSFMNWIQMSEI